ncbi:MAG TPA: YwiC-like family protein [Bacillus sp. (in: firmicutes)]|nr:YwiC-like family protein [Bacillus sp. (in: firmicutes)]
MVLPREHGTWMMFFLPYLLGVFLSGPKWIHLPLLIGWFFLYLSSTPLFSMIRKPRLKAEMLPWFAKYGVIAAIFTLPVIWLYSVILWIVILIVPLLLISSYFIKQKNERSLWNDLSGILIFSLGGAAAYLIGQGSLTIDALLLPMFITLYFMGSAFYVKSLIRERTNRTFRIKSHIYHGFLLIAPWIIGLPWMSVSYLPGILKDWATSRKKPLKPTVIGMIEIINGIVFFALCLYIFSRSSGH